MTYRYENKKKKEGYLYIIGCDEVGRGSLAGPVVASAVILPRQAESEKFKVIKSAGIRDSKLLTAAKRQDLSKLIKECSMWSVGQVSSGVIDKINIHNATLLAMKKAIQNLFMAYSHELATQKVFTVIDGRFVVPKYNAPQEAIIDGDNKILSIAAASIVAKVYRDDLMTRLHNKHPVYNFAQHKGYGTLYHRQMIQQHGLSPIHRLTFYSN